MSDQDFSWAIKLMRFGYGGRGLTYLVIAGVSLWGIWAGGSAESTGSALQSIESSTWGKVALFLIFFGLMAYAIWRVVCAWNDLEDYGGKGKGMIARTGQIVTGLIHGAIGFGAFLLLFTGASSDEESTVAKAASAVMEWPGGRWVVLFAGICTIGAGLYYLKKSWSESYRDHLMGNEFTANWNAVLQAGVAAQGFIVLIIGIFIAYAGWTANASEAHGLGGVWEFLYGQPFGNVLVVIVCLGLLAFAVFCFVNARYRIVPRAAEKDIRTLASELKARAA